MPLNLKCLIYQSKTKHINVNSHSFCLMMEIGELQLAIAYV